MAGVTASSPRSRRRTSRTLKQVWRFQTAPESGDQGFADSGGWRHLHHHAGQSSGPSTRARRRNCGTISIPDNNAFHIGHRGAAVYKDTVYLTHPDCHLIALNAKDGKIKWDVVIADSGKGYWSTNAPLVVKNHVLVGVSGDFDNVPGH